MRKFKKKMTRYVYMLSWVIFCFVNDIHWFVNLHGYHNAYKLHSRHIEFAFSKNIFSVMC